MSRNIYFAVTMSFDNEGHYPGDFLYRNYYEFFSHFGCSFIYLPNGVGQIDDYFNDLPIKGVILSGGNDISDPPSVRDIFEKKVLDSAIERKLPVLGICRGMQFINHYFGGMITYNFETAKELHVAKNHNITIMDDRAAAYFGQQEVEVNSYHNHGVREDQLASCLRIMALSAKDRIVEGLYHPLLPVAGVQWHPERQNPYADIDRKLARAFIDRSLYWEAERS